MTERRDSRLCLARSWACWVELTQAWSLDGLPFQPTLFIMIAKILMITVFIEHLLSPKPLIWILFFHLQNRHHSCPYVTDGETEAQRT